ncbi:competence protein ComGC [Clostridium algifaecis]|uniref:Competence protein ComGC n=1 Tax=Clostridium algifaecis TaxID=1472040 RepID=A0ABS4KQ89_9CLOT|nr:hypothetical protein [Clostridium algifaecis]MBP2032206.1 competence protein ComGC [Clostridium algifaecis]
MLKRNIKIIAALTILTSLNMNFTIVHASSVKISSTISETTFKNNNHRHHDYKPRLDKLVHDGVITEKQENAALNLIKSDEFHEFMKKNHKCSRNNLDALVKNGTITSNQETSIKKAFLSSKKQGKKFKTSFNNELDALVNKKIINEKQKTAVQNSFIACRKEHINNLTVFFKHKFDTLVNNGTITQKQEDAIIKSLITFKHK